MEKYGQKRRKKHAFADDGETPIEPFHMRQDMEEGIVTREGALNIENMHRRKALDEEDPWLASIVEQ